MFKNICQCDDAQQHSHHVRAIITYCMYVVSLKQVK